MSKYKDADLILKLYDLRREKTMRDARNWFFTFNPQTPQDFMDVLTSEKSGGHLPPRRFYVFRCASVPKAGKVNKTEPIVDSEEVQRLRPAGS